MTRSPRWIIFDVAVPCGSALLGPDATIVGNDAPMAPRSRNKDSRSLATLASDLPRSPRPIISIQAFDANSAAVLIVLISSGDFRILRSSKRFLLKLIMDVEPVFLARALINSKEIRVPSRPTVLRPSRFTNLASEEILFRVT